MAPTTEQAQERLDSWKAIAEYLDRDVATVRRWEKSLRLPVRRVGGASRGHSVFAYRNEIDDWLKLQDLSGNARPAEAPEETAVAPAPAPTPVHTRPRWHWASAAAIAAVGIISVGIAGAAWRSRGADVRDLTVELTPAGVVARERGGAERWRRDFPPGERVIFPEWHDRVSPGAFDNGRPFVTATSYSEVAAGGAKSGELLQLSSDGRIERTFAFDDRLAFGQTTYSPPWAITDYRQLAGDGAPRIAVAAHHIHWWPSVVTVLNERWERTGTFVHSGWVERLHWLSGDRLIMVGFSNARDGGMVALLDPTAMSGQSPRTGNAAFSCDACGPESAVRYLVLPRSELNRVTGSPFNRTQLEIAGDRVVVRTIEVPKEAHPADALYEFSPALGLLGASYGDRYWELHASLEAEGKINHRRDRCPDRDGPRAIEVWEPVTGWKTVTVR